MQSNLFVSCFITSLVYKRKLQKNGIEGASYASSFNVFRENKDSDNCAKLLEEECVKMFGTKSLNDEHDCNVVSTNSIVLMMIALIMMKMSPINMSIFVECIGFVSAHQIGKIDIARGIST